MIGIIIFGLVGIGILAWIIYFAVKSINNDPNIPKASEQKPISKLTRKQIKKLA